MWLTGASAKTISPAATLRPLLLSLFLGCSICMQHEHCGSQAHLPRPFWSMLKIQPATSPSHNNYTNTRPTSPVLTLYCKVPSRAATGVPICRSLVPSEQGKQDMIHSLEVVASPSSYGASCQENKTSSRQSI